MRKPIVRIISFISIVVLILLAAAYQTNIPAEAYSLKTLSIIDYWNQHSIIQSNFIPTIDSSQNYYLSHPPFSYYCLYFFQKYTISSTYYILNAFLLGISSLFIYLTICLLTLKKAKEEYSLFAFIGVLIYISSYPVLRFQFFNYHPDIFVLTILIICQYIFLKLLIKERYRSIKYMILTTLFLFLLVYSSWFGLIFSLIVILIALFNLRKGYKLIPYIILSSIVVILCTLLIYSQYAVVGGWKNVIYYFKDTYLRESPLLGNLQQTGWQIILQLIMNIGNLILILFFLVLYSFIARKRKFLFTKNGYRYLILSVFPILIYSVLLLQYFQNTFACLYFIPPLVITISVWLEKILKTEKNPWLILKIVLLIVLSNLSLFINF